VGGDSAGGEPVITLDCAGVPDGLAYEDPCGVCDRDPSNDCVQDCSGEWGGARVLNDCGECVLGGQSDCARAVETPTISAMGEFESGVGGAPLTCVDGVQSEGETMVDCGGDCSACGQASDETLAVRLATYYQRVVYPDLYIMRSIYQMERRGELVYLHYGFASVDAPGVEAGQDSRAFVLNAQGEVVAQNGHLSGELIAPLSCADGLLNGDEVEVDCGGSCGGCGVINRAELGLRVKRYYDLEGPWAGSYVLVELVVLNPSADGLSADVLYGFGLESEQAPPIGFDSRRFEYGLP